jgi:hypothetical protein
MVIEFRQVIEGICLAKLAGVNQAHENVPHVGAVAGLVEQGISPAADGLLERALIMPSWLSSFSRKRSR